MNTNKPWTKNWKQILNKDLISTDIQNAVNFLQGIDDSSNCDIIFTGSLSLVALGLLRRKVIDLDIIINEIPTQIPELRAYLTQDNPNQSINIKDEFDRDFRYYAAKIMNVDVDIFYFHPNRKISYYEISNPFVPNYFGSIIKMGEPSDIISAKKACIRETKFQKNKDKHTNDINSIKSTLSSIWGGSYP